MSSSSSSSSSKEEIVRIAIGLLKKLRLLVYNHSFVTWDDITDLMYEVFEEEYGEEGEEERYKFINVVMNLECDSPEDDYLFIVHMLICYRINHNLRELFDRKYKEKSDNNSLLFYLFDPKEIHDTIFSLIEKIDIIHNSLSIKD